MSSANPLAATVEDYDSDAEDKADPLVKLSEQSPTHTKVPAPPHPVASSPPDAASDSGYSSRTAATLGSADSADKILKPQLAPKSDSSSHLSKPRTTTTNERRKESQPTVKPLQPRPSSRTSAQPSSGQPPPFRRCSQPNCADCVAMHRSQKRSPLESPWNFEYPPIVSTPPPQSPYPQSLSSSSSYLYPQYGAYQVSSVPLVSIPTPRERSYSQTAAQAPRSFQQGNPTDGYWVPVNTPRYDHGPPPAPSAYANPSYTSNPYPHYLQAPSSSTMAYNPSLSAFGYPSPSTTPVSASAYPSARPALPHSATDSLVRRTNRPRPVSMYDAGFLGIRDASAQPSSGMMPRSSSRPRSPYDLHTYEEVDRQRMPPPPLPSTRPTSRRHQDSSRHSGDRYSSGSSDSSGTSPHTATRAHHYQPRTERRQSSSKLIPKSSSTPATKDQLEYDRGRKAAHAAHEKRRDLGRPENAKSSREAEPGQDRMLRRARTTSRPSRSEEESLHQKRSSRRTSSRPGRGTEAIEAGQSANGLYTDDGFKIEVARQGMNINLNGQRISVIPKDGGLAELIIGSHHQEPQIYVEGASRLSQSTATHSRERRSSRRYSEIGPVGTGSASVGSASPTRPATAQEEKK